MCFSNLQKKIFQKTILNLKFKFPTNNSKVFLEGNLNFKLRIVFWNIFFWRFEKRISLSEKKAPLALVHTSRTQGWWGIFGRIFWRFLLVSVSGRVGTRWRIICTVFCVGWIWIRENQIFIYATSHYHMTFIFHE